MIASHIPAICLAALAGLTLVTPAFAVVNLDHVTPINDPWERVLVKEPRHHAPMFRDRGGLAAVADTLLIIHLFVSPLSIPNLS